MENLKRTLEARIAEADERLEQLNQLIEAARIAGMDVTHYELKRDELATRINKWKQALSKLSGA